MPERPTDSAYSKSLFWMVLALCIGLGVLVGGAFFTASRILKALHAPSGEGQAIHTAGGDFRLQRPDEVGPGLPIYPGALLVLQGVENADPGVVKAGRAA